MSPDSTMATSTFPSETMRIQKLNSSNWQSWKFKMQMVLEEKDLWDIVDGSEGQPEPEGDLEDLSRQSLVAYQKQVQQWEKKDRKARATIILGVEDSQLGHVKGAETAGDTWEKLCAVYENRGLANRLFLRRKFFTATWEHGESMLQVVNRIKEMAEQLAAIGAPVSEEDTVMTILSALPETFNTVVTALESRNATDLALDFVSARLVHEDLKHSDVSNSNTNEKALATTNNYHSKPISEAAKRIADVKKRTKCRKCGKKGHWWKECTAANGGNGGNGGWKGNGGGNQANNASEQLFAVSSNPSLTPTGPICNDWFIDSGASQHYVQNRSNFADYTTVQQQRVYLGDDTHLEVVGCGVVELDVWNGEEWRRTRVADALHVPGLAKNLLAVSKLAERNLCTQFYKDRCEIRSSNAILGLGVREGNLYKLICRMPTANQANIASSNDAARMDVNKLALWHHRLAHLNYQAVKATQKHAEGMGEELGRWKAEFCEDRVAGKQHREPFPRDQHTEAKDVLQLVSSDVCGPTRTATHGGNC